MKLVARTCLTVVSAAAVAAACGSGDLSPITAPPGAIDGAVPPPSDAGHPPPGNDASVPPPADAWVPPADAGGGACKRGIASTTAPSAALAPSGSTPGVSWWYDWSNQPSAAPAAGIDFVPMIWGSGALAGPIPQGSHYLLGFNEPNFKAQANLTPQQAATDWPMVESLAKAQGIPIVSPAVNFCGSASNPSGCSDPTVTDPYTWLKDFFTACPGCEVDAIAIHWYNCDLPSLQAYIEGNGGGLQGFVQFGKPLWVTEVSCDGSKTAAQQQAYMQAAVPYLEGNPHIARYSWFSSSNIASALLTNPDGSLTALGSTYVALPQTCH
jgi:hypothetical protein